MKAEMTPLKEGVANFRSFQTRGEKFFTRHDTLADANEKRRKRNLVIAGIVSTFLVPAVCFVSSRVWNEAVEVAQIVQEWDQLHHSIVQQEKSSSSPAQDDTHKARRN